MNLDGLSLAGLDDHARRSLAACTTVDVKAALVVLVELQRDGGGAIDLGQMLDQIRHLSPRRRRQLAARVDDRGHVYDGEAPPPPPADDDGDDENIYGRLLAEDDARAAAAARRAALATEIDARAFQISAERGVSWERARRQAVAELVGA